MGGVEAKFAEIIEPLGRVAAEYQLFMKEAAAAEDSVGMAPVLAGRLGGIEQRIKGEMALMSGRVDQLGAAVDGFGRELESGKSELSDGIALNHKGIVEL